MFRLEDQKTGGFGRGALPNGVVAVVTARWCGSGAVGPADADPAGETCAALLEIVDERAARCRALGAGKVGKSWKGL